MHIFNLFIFLFSIWIFLIFICSSFSFSYILLGIISSALISFICARLRLTQKNSEFLYLSFGFYRHFLSIFFKNFFSSIFLICRLAFTKQPIRPIATTIKLPYNKSHLALLTASINMMTGISCVKIQNEKITIHAIDKKYLEKLDLQELCHNLQDINDDNLI